MREETAPKSRLATAITEKAQKPSGRFAKAIAANRPRKPFRIPRVGIDAIMVLVPHRRQEEIVAEVWERMRQLRLDPGPLVQGHYEAAVAARMLVEAVRDPATVTAANAIGDPFGTLDDWEGPHGLDTDVISDCWRIYCDFATEADPVGAPLTETEIGELIDAVKKKDARLLRAYGSRMLSLFLLVMGDRLSISVTPKSPPTESSSESSTAEMEPDELATP